jgi:hypothetical protein
VTAPVCQYIYTPANSPVGAAQLTRRIVTELKATAQRETNTRERGKKETLAQRVEGNNSNSGVHTETRYWITNEVPPAGNCRIRVWKANKPQATYIIEAYIAPAVCVLYRFTAALSWRHISYWEAARSLLAKCSLFPPWIGDDCGLQTEKNKQFKTCQSPAQWRIRSQNFCPALSVKCVVTSTIIIIRTGK